MNKLIIEPCASNGGLSSVVISGDEYEMNWCASDTATWGVPYHNAQTAFNRFDPLVYVGEVEGNYVYKNAFLTVSVRRSFNDAGFLSEEYTVENTSSNPVFVGKGEFGVFVPFNDSYESAEVCQTSHCHAHIFTGGCSAWVCALRMGISDLNLGLILKEGKIDCYRQWLPPYAKNDRGDFMLCAAPFDLLPGEKYTVSWDIVVHSGKEDFISRLSEYENQIVAETKFETVFKGEEIEIDLSKSGSIGRGIGWDNIDLSADFESGDPKRVFFRPARLGEATVSVANGRGELTALKYFVSPGLDVLVRARVYEICDCHQFRREGHPLDGAYLIFDEETRTPYFSNAVADHNASRERIGMGILVAKYLQKYRGRQRKFLKESLDNYESFVFREFVDPETGDVFDTIGRDPSQIRLYNAPWVCVFVCELYKLKHDKEYLRIASRVMEKYYAGGGDHFYPNAFSVAEPIVLMRKAGLKKESDALFEAAKRHTENIIENGTNYPKHEVDYEQTIVAPALTFILQMYELTGDPRYIEEARPHLALLERFNGFQPDYRLNEVAIRHWDDYWFGKSAMFGDTFPHYWSVLSGWCFHLWYKATGDEVYKYKAEKSARNSLCLFNPDGTASCAYMFPYMVNDRRGEFFDAWANDQDFALYFAIKILMGEK